MRVCVCVCVVAAAAWQTLVLLEELGLSCPQPDRDSAVSVGYSCLRPQCQENEGAVQLRDSVAWSQGSRSAVAGRLKSRCLIVPLPPASPRPPIGFRAFSNASPKVTPYYKQSGNRFLFGVPQTSKKRERESARNSNSKTLFYKDCSLGSFKNLSNN